MPYRHTLQRRYRTRRCAPSGRGYLIKARPANKKQLSTILGQDSVLYALLACAYIFEQKTSPLVLGRTQHGTENQGNILDEYGKRS